MSASSLINCVILTLIPTYIRASCGRSGRLERKGEERSHAEKGKCHEVIPRELLFQERGRESHEDDEGDNFLNHLKLVSRKLVLPVS